MKNFHAHSIIIVLTLIFSLACDKSEDTDIKMCDKNVVVSSNEYKNAPNDPLSIQNAEIIGDCLKIKFTASGCSGDSWKVNLIDSELIYFSFPPQRKLRLSLKNGEVCGAMIGKEYTFSIKDLQVNGSKLLINIENYDDKILYEY